jgi:hypothetical protein
LLRRRGWSKTGLDFYNRNVDVCCGDIVGMGEHVDDRLTMLVLLANLPNYPENAPIISRTRSGVCQSMMTASLKSRVRTEQQRHKNRSASNPGHVSRPGKPGANLQVMRR